MSREITCNNNFEISLMVCMPNITTNHAITILIYKKFPSDFYPTDFPSGWVHNARYMYMLWFKFFLGLNFIFLCLKLIIIHYHTQKQRKIKFKPRKKLNHNIYTLTLCVSVYIHHYSPPLWRIVVYCPQNHPQYLSGLLCACFSTTLLKMLYTVIWSCCLVAAQTRVSIFIWLYHQAAQ